MLKILSATDLKAADAFTIDHEPIESIDLMERASKAFVSWFTERFEIKRKIGVVCGTGNNGGDGLAIARMLKIWGYHVEVWIVVGGKNSPDYSRNFARLGSAFKIHKVETAADVLSFDRCHILVDAIFGYGMSRPVTGIYEHVINQMNLADCVRVAVDVPSGMLTDKHTEGVAIRAAFTVTFQVPKIAFMFPENSEFVGDWSFVDIRLDRKFIKEITTPYYYLTSKSVKKKIKIRRKYDNKGDHGKALLIAGSFGKMGACVLSARAALRAGVGLLTVHTPTAGYNIIQSSVPEAMAITDTNEKYFTGADALDKFNVIGIGPGIGQEKKTKSGLESVLNAGKPMVIDADALNILGEHRELMKLIPKGSILSPHPKEFERLTEKWTDDFDRLEKQKKLSKEFSVVVILKGAHTSIASPDGKVFFNSTGNPGMATGGAGDVLTGILTGLLAQGYSATDAALIGVFLHGQAGDMAAGRNTNNSLIASDLIDYLPLAFKKTLTAGQ